MVHENLLQGHNGVIFLGSRLVDLTARGSINLLLYKRSAGNIPEGSLAKFANKFKVSNVRASRKPRLALVVLLEGSDRHFVLNGVGRSTRTGIKETASCGVYR